MKSLTESINESLINEGLITAMMVAIILTCICLAETLYYTLKPDNQEYNADHSIKGLMTHDGVVMGFIEWIFERFGDLHELLKDARIRREMDRIEASPEFKEYMKLPKSKRTLKKLREIGKNVNTKDLYAVISIWDEFKRASHVSDTDLKDEIS